MQFVIHPLKQQTHPIRFALTTVQQQTFNTYFAQIQNQYLYLCGIDYIATIRRLGLITFRIAMILTTLRIMETGEIPTTSKVKSPVMSSVARRACGAETPPGHLPLSPLTCSNTDFNSKNPEPPRHKNLRRSTHRNQTAHSTKPKTKIPRKPTKRIFKKRLYCHCPNVQHTNKNRRKTHRQIRPKRTYQPLCSRQISKKRKNNKNRHTVKKLRQFQLFFVSLQKNKSVFYEK
jgi:hypothetical protein